jgi:WD40 repeat protein
MVAIDGSVHVWNADGSQEWVVLAGHSGRINAIEYSHDGGRIVTAGIDHTVRIWRDLDPLSADDPNLWKRTNECLSTDLRQKLLGLTEPMARSLYQRCQARVAAARP